MNIWTYFRADPLTNVAYEAGTERDVARHYANALQDLIEHAADDGVVLTIELEPVAPLAMGHYVMRGHVRGAR